MGPQEDYIETVFTCEGDFNDPDLHSRLEVFHRGLQDLLRTDEQNLILKKVEPWNSVRVTFNIPKEAALRLKHLAEQGNAALREMGVLAVQIQGDQLISLTIAGKNNERAELVFRTTDSTPQPPSKVPAQADAGAQQNAGQKISPPASTEQPEKNILDYFKQGTTLFDSLFGQCSSAAETFLSPNVVATSRDPIPCQSTTSTSSYGGAPGTSVSGGSLFAFPPGRSPTGYPTSPSHGFPASSGAHSPVGQPGLKFPSPPGMPSSIAFNRSNPQMLPPPPPYSQTPHSQFLNVNSLSQKGRNLTSSSPLLVNLLQADVAAAGGGLNNMMLSVATSCSKMLPPVAADPPQKRKRRPRKPKESKPPATVSDGEISIQSIPNPALSPGSLPADSTQQNAAISLASLPGHSTDGAMQNPAFYSMAMPPSGYGPGLTNPAVFIGSTIMSPAGHSIPPSLTNTSAPYCEQEERVSPFSNFLQQTAASSQHNSTMFGAIPKTGEQSMLNIRGGNPLAAHSFTHKLSHTNTAELRPMGDTDTFPESTLGKIINPYTGLLEPADSSASVPNKAVRPKKVKKKNKNSTNTNREAISSPAYGSNSMTNARQPGAERITQDVSSQRSDLNPSAAAFASGNQAPPYTATTCNSATRWTEDNVVSSSSHSVASLNVEAELIKNIIEEQQHTNNPAQGSHKIKQFPSSSSDTRYQLNSGAIQSIIATSSHEQMSVEAKSKPQAEPNMDRKNVHLHNVDRVAPTPLESASNVIYSQHLSSQASHATTTGSPVLLNEQTHSLPVTRTNDETSSLQSEVKVPTRSPEVEAETTLRTSVVPPATESSTSALVAQPFVTEQQLSGKKLLSTNYNHDSGLGSNSEPSDDTPSEPGENEAQKSVEVEAMLGESEHIEHAKSKGLEHLSQRNLKTDAKTITVGYALTNDTYGKQQNRGNIENRYLGPKKMSPNIYGVQKPLISEFRPSNQMTVLHWSMKDPVLSENCPTQASLCSQGAPMSEVEPVCHNSTEKCLSKSPSLKKTSKNFMTDSPRNGPLLMMEKEVPFCYPSRSLTHGCPTTAADSHSFHRHDRIPGPLPLSHTDTIVQKTLPTYENNGLDISIPTLKEPRNLPAASTVHSPYAHVISNESRMSSSTAGSSANNSPAFIMSNQAILYPQSVAMTTLAPLVTTVMCTLSQGVQMSAVLQSVYSNTSMRANDIPICQASNRSVPQQSTPLELLGAGGVIQQRAPLVCAPPPLYPSHSNILSQKAHKECTSFSVASLISESNQTSATTSTSKALNDTSATYYNSVGHSPVPGSTTYDPQTGKMSAGSPPNLASASTPPTADESNLKTSNITSMYTRKSCATSAIMHATSPPMFASAFLPLPKRLTESVQKLVKALPSADLPHYRKAAGGGSPRVCSVMSPQRQLAYRASEKPLPGCEDVPEQLQPESISIARSPGKSKGRTTPLQAENLSASNAEFPNTGGIARTIEPETSLASHECPCPIAVVQNSPPFSLTVTATITDVPVSDLHVVQKHLLTTADDGCAMPLMCSRINFEPRNSDVSVNTISQSNNSAIVTVPVAECIRVSLQPVDTLITSNAEQYVHDTVVVTTAQIQNTSLESDSVFESGVQVKLLSPNSVAASCANDTNSVFEVPSENVNEGELHSRSDVSLSNEFEHISSVHVSNSEQARPGSSVYTNTILSASSSELHAASDSATTVTVDRVSSSSLNLLARVGSLQQAVEHVATLLKPQSETTTEAAVQMASEIKCHSQMGVTSTLLTNATNSANEVVILNLSEVMSSSNETEHPSSNVVKIQQIDDKDSGPSQPVMIQATMENSVERFEENSFSENVSKANAASKELKLSLNSKVEIDNVYVRHPEGEEMVPTRNLRPVRMSKRRSTEDVNEEDGLKSTVDAAAKQLRFPRRKRGLNADMANAVNDELTNKKLKLDHVTDQTDLNEVAVEVWHQNSHLPVENTIDNDVSDEKLDSLKSGGNRLSDLKARSRSSAKDVKSQDEENGVRRVQQTRRNKQAPADCLEKTVVRAVRNRVNPSVNAEHVMTEDAPEPLKRSTRSSKTALEHTPELLATNKRRRSSRDHR